MFYASCIQRVRGGLDGDMTQIRPGQMCTEGLITEPRITKILLQCGISRIDRISTMEEKKSVLGAGLSALSSISINDKTVRGDHALTALPDRADHNKH